MPKVAVDPDGVVQDRSALTPDGRFELPDPVPMAPPVGYEKSPSLGELIRRMVRQERFNAEVAAQGFETFEEADDFDIEDDPLDPLTPYERVFDPAQPGAPGAAAPGAAPAGGNSVGATPPAPPVSSTATPASPPVTPPGSGAAPAAAQPPAHTST